MSDQWLEAFVIVDDDGKPVGTIQDDDAVSPLSRTLLLFLFLLHSGLIALGVVFYHSCRHVLNIPIGT